MNKIFIDLIKEICKELQINYKIFSKGWAIMLENEGKTKFISGFKFDLNGHALGDILDDKFATYDLLKSCEIPTIEHSIVYGNDNENEYAKDCKGANYIKKVFHKYEKNVVLKTNEGACGTNIIHIKDENELVSEVNRLTKSHTSLSICPYYDIENEYRAIVLNNNVELLYKKIKPVVVGDSRKTIKELLDEFNYAYFKNINKEEFNKVLNSGEIYEYDWKFNLSRGAKLSFDILETDKKSIQGIAEKISSKIGINFGSIDIVKTIDNRYYIMEINSGVMTNNFIKQIDNGYEIAKSIYTKAIKCLMQEY